MEIDFDNFDFDALYKYGLHPLRTLKEEEAVLRVCLAASNPGAVQVVSHEHRGASTEAARRISKFPGVKPETVCDFLIKNCPPSLDEFDLADLGIPPQESSHVLAWRPQIEKLVYLEHGEWNDIFRWNSDGGWNVFRARYPESHGIISFSRVGLDAQGQQALLCCGAQYDYLMGRGDYVFLKLMEDGWQIVKRELAWMS